MKYNLAQLLSSRTKAWWQVHQKNDASIVFFLLAVLIACLAYLIWGDDPWRHQLPQKFIAGEYLSANKSITLGLWAGAVINALISSILLFSSYWWPQGKPHAHPSTVDKPFTTQSKPWVKRLFYLGLISALLGAAWIRAPRLEHSFWNDEEMPFRKYLWGEYVPTDAGELEHKPVSWKRTFFYTTTGNNHLTQTVSSRITHDVWKFFFHQEEERPFHESILRLMPFINSLLGIAALAFLMRLSGYPLAGVTAAWILALNPWHLRYSVEARGYADLMLFIPLTFIALIYALRSNKWRWWLAYGLLQSLYLLAFAGAAYLAIAQNLIVLMLLLKQRKHASLWKWSVSTSIGAMLFIFIMTPMVIEYIEYVKAHPHLTFPLTIAHLQDLWAHLILGVPWKSVTDSTLHNGMSVQTYQNDYPVIRSLTVFVFPALLLIGSVTALIKNKELRIFITSSLGALALITLHNSLSQNIFHIWYMIYTVLIFAAALAFLPMLIATGGRSIRQGNFKSIQTYTAFGSAMILVIAYGAMTAPALARIRNFERMPMREVVESVRSEAPALDPVNANILTCSIGSGAVQMRSYDPWVHPVKKQADFDSVLKEARESGKPLFIYVCSPLRVKREFPETWKLLEDPAIFEKIAYFKGLEEFWSYQTYQLKR